jgi:hypothetical protein
VRPVTDGRSDSGEKGVTSIPQLPSLRPVLFLSCTNVAGFEQKIKEKKAQITLVTSMGHGAF